jgi:hypothetical protein
LSDVIGNLHPQQMIDIRPERLMDAQRHLCRERRLAVDEIRQRRAPYAENGRGFGDGKVEPRESRAK